MADKNTETPDREELKQLLRNLRENPQDKGTKQKLRSIFQNTDASLLATVEEELIAEGVSREEIRSGLCDIHLEAIGDNLEAQKQEPDPGHPIHTFMEEHKLIRQSLEDLLSVTRKLGTLSSVAEMGDDFQTLQNATHHLVEAESHYQREEEALFPALEMHAIFEPPQIMREEHVDLRERKKRLNELVHGAEQEDFSHFQKEMEEIGEYLGRVLYDHTFKEDNILYQIALQVITEDEWTDIKRKADEIGYCCFAPNTE